MVGAIHCGEKVLSFTEAMAMEVESEEIDRCRVKVALCCVCDLKVL